MKDTQNDHSTRFIMDESAPYLANLAALWAVDPKLAANIEAMESLPSYSLSPSRAKNSAPTLVMTTADGREILLHTRHDPLDEAKRLIDPLPLEDRAAFAIWGFGLGYHVAELFDRAGDDAVLCVFEPDLVMLRTAFESRDFSDLLLGNRVMFFTELDKADLFARLQRHMPAVSLGLQSITHAPSIQLVPDFYKQFQFWTNEFESYVRTTIATLVINGRRTSENIARNLPWYVSSPGVGRLKNCYAKKPAIIVSAGPSLRKNMHLLKDAQGKSVIIAVQTTLQPLLEIGVRPQFVTSLDYHEICTRFFEKLPKDLTTELIAEPKASNAVFDLNPGPLSLLGNEFADGLISEMNLDRPRLTSGATVAHLAFYLAEHMGCDPIILVGQDLGFSDGLCYSPGTSYEDVWRPELSRFNTLEMKQWEQIVRDRKILRRIPDYQGRPTYTEERLFTYLQHFERDFAKTKSRVIDATEGGVMKRGAAPMKLIDALNEFCRDGFEVSPPAHPGMDWSRLSDCQRSLETRREQAKQIERISRETMPLLEEIRDNIADQQRVNQLISQI
ncbi:MAG: motility associated factor glycosyltransferase family protein, partial [Anaerolineae bacterium]|nr:motility associated factor glycosyltransferase family protein [Phycisphaerae bacterium]